MNSSVSSLVPLLDRILQGQEEIQRSIESLSERVEQIGFGVGKDFGQVTTHLYQYNKIFIATFCLHNYIAILMFCIFSF